MNMKISLICLASLLMLCFSIFFAIVNKMKENITVMPYSNHDRALKLLHILDRDVWGMEVDAIIEST